MKVHALVVAVRLKVHLRQLTGQCDDVSHREHQSAVLLVKEQRVEKRSQLLNDAAALIVLVKQFAKLRESFPGVSSVDLVIKIHLKTIVEDGTLVAFCDKNEKEVNCSSAEKCEQGKQDLI